MMEEYAKKLATECRINSFSSKKNFPRERVREDFNTEMHIDTDEANAAQISTGQTVSIIK